jgi:hypothetical protein
MEEVMMETDGDNTSLAGVDRREDAAEKFWIAVVSV